MENKIKQPLYIVSLTAIFLVVLSFVKVDYLIEKVNFTIRTVDVLSDIKDVPVEEPAINALNATPLYNKASLNIIPLFRSAAEAIVELFNEPAPAQGVKTPITGNTKQLSNFFEAVKLAKSKSVRVAHFGDSAIEGDLITADMRETMQNKFGGNGVGWLGIVSQDITFRMTTKHSFSQGNWDVASAYTNNPKGLPLGVSAEAFVPKGNAWVQYETTPMRRYLRDFNTVKVYYTNAKASSINYTFDGGAKQTMALKPGAGVQELILKPAGKAKKIKIEFPVAEQATFFGATLENDPGVYVDNFPLRGNSGVDLQQVSVPMLKEFAKYMDYKLIILEFGLNIAGNKTDYTWYEREMTKVINNFKAAFPKASIVLVSVHDKSMKKGSEFVTDPAITRLVASQKNLAKTTDVAIWSLFDAMGGQNSMPTWVNSNPPLAFKDYIHFNDQGAKKVAQLFTDALFDEFNKSR
ncbi:MAG: periplasmic protein [Stygiobacter sp.]|nr:MAG: periplasmic protein [Stygiobacter sp.]KAF0213737.1 MAG: periplasmic [Ignavibacteria bacterium]